MRFQSIIALAFILSTSIPAYSLEDCSKTLVVDTYRENFVWRKDYRLSKFLSKKDFDDLKRDFATSGEAIIYGIPVSSSTSYEDYQRHSVEILEKIEENFSEHQAKNIYWEALSGNALRAYKLCVQSRTNGLFLDVESATKTDLVILVKYSPTSLTPPIKLSWSGATPEILKDMPESIRSREATRRVIKRPASGEFQLALNVLDENGPEAPEAILITAWPGSPPPLPQAPCKAVNSAGQCLRCGGTLVGSALPPGSYQHFMCRNVVPNQEYLMKIKGQVQTHGADRNVGSFIVLSLNGPKNEVLQRSGFDTSPDTGDAAKLFSFSSPQPLLVDTDRIRGSLYIEGCGQGGRSMPCNILTGEWEICLFGNDCGSK